MSTTRASCNRSHPPGDDGTTPIFTTATCWSVLVFFVLAMQCLPTLAVTAKEAGARSGPCSNSCG